MPDLTDDQKYDIRTVRIFAANAGSYLLQATAAKAALDRLEADPEALAALRSKYPTAEDADQALSVVG